MKITERYIKAKAQQALKSLIQAKSNYVKGSEEMQEVVNNLVWREKMAKLFK